MQTFNLDISAKRIVPLLNVKQGDVGARIAVAITNNGAAYTIPGNTVFSVWYSGASGEGNYTTIGDKSAFSVSGNTVTVELILQMLQNEGPGKLCLVMNGMDGSQLGLWNIPYFVEKIPGANSNEATAYYTAFLDAATRAEAAAVRAEAAASSLVTAPKSVTGAEITIEDAEDNSVFHGLKLYGKSTQDGTPSLENPVNVVHAGADGSIIVNVNDTQTLTALTPNGLPGIKVSGGGNYTDSNGQQWICDEMDFADGVYRKWIDSHTFTGNETIWLYGGAAVAVGTYPDVAGKTCDFGGCCSNLLRGAYGYSGLMDNDNTIAAVTNGIAIHFAGLQGHAGADGDATALCNAYKAKLKELATAGTPLTVYYQLATPIETPLSAEELEQYASLRTSAPTTTVSNDENVAMEVSYYPPCAALPSSGGTVGGVVNMAGNRITGLGDPIGESDAVPKSYLSPPPMLFGVEYLTNEMWGGNHVYEKIITFSVYGNSEATLDITDEPSRVIHVEGFYDAIDDWFGSRKQIPVYDELWDTLSAAARIVVNGERISRLQVKLPSGATADTCFFTLKYIKL